jgi:hypothetical protein
MCHLVWVFGAITLIYSNAVSAILRFDPSPRYVIPSELNGKVLKLAAQEVSDLILAERNDFYYLKQGPPFTIFERNSAGEITSFKGYCFEIISALHDVYNFT